VRLIQRLEAQIQIKSFIPTSFVLPSEKADFQAFLERKTCIVKPDEGALGSGIEIVDRHTELHPCSALCVAQEYIDECFLYRGYKFDLRVYALAVFKSADDFAVYVYREGIARVCSEKYGGTSAFARLTNTAVNKRHPDVNMENITKMMSTVFTELHFNRERLWRRIDQVIALSVISAIGFISKGIRESRQDVATFFQLFGFDVLIDSDKRPKVLEVNYRPSLCGDIAAERQLKQDMIVDLCHVVRPANRPQSPQLSESWVAWQRFVVENPATKVGFDRIFPTRGKRQQQYKAAIAAVRRANTEWDPALPNSRVPAKIRSERGGQAVQPRRASNAAPGARLKGSPVAHRDRPPM
jgi:hypothetical protein